MVTQSGELESLHHICFDHTYKVNTFICVLLREDNGIGEMCAHEGVSHQFLRLARLTAPAQYRDYILVFDVISHFENQF